MRRRPVRPPAGSSSALREWVAGPLLCAQSGLSAVRDTTRSVLIVAEALHPGAPADIARLAETVTAEMSALWRATPRAAVLTAAAPRFPLT